MNSGLYVALSAQIATERRLSTIADNVANMNTTGFRETGVRFAELVDGPRPEAKSFVTPGTAWMSEKQGAIELTGNQFDFAINGKGWFLVQTPSGDAVTRDGRMTVNADGILVNLGGFPVLDQGGGLVQIDPSKGQLVADKSGILFQNKVIAGSIGVFDYDGPNERQRLGSLSLVPEGAVTPVTDWADFTVEQGYVENSNVDAVSQIAKLIAVQRNFEGNANLIQQTESALAEAIKLLGGR